MKEEHHYTKRFSGTGSEIHLGDSHILLKCPVKVILHGQIIRHGACLGLGLAALETADEDIYDEIKSVLYTDSAVAGEASGGYDLLGRTKDQIRTTKQVNSTMATCNALKLDDLVIVGHCDICFSGSKGFFKVSEAGSEKAAAVA
nr:26S proteasome regulatory complex, non-ATPase subcomplex, Rpn2/Psmd1 subunit [Tanacetum cinerariifolium]